MLNFQCPSCQSKCSVDDQFRGRKLKCPKCRTRIRHHLDGTIELLTLGEVPPPPPPAAAAPAAAGATGGADTATPAVPVQQEVAAPPVPAVVDKFASQSEAKQNRAIIWGVTALLGIAVLAYSIVMDNMVVFVGAVALVLVSAFGFLFVRNQVRQAKLAQAAAAKKAASPAPGGAATEPLGPAVAAPVAAVPPPAPAAPASPAPAPPAPAPAVPAPPPAAAAPPPPDPAPAAPAAPPASPAAPPASSVEDDAPTDHLTIIE